MAIISEIPGRGHIKHCPSHGCVHLTYRTVTLHIASAEAFLMLARAWSGVIEQRPIHSAATRDPQEWVVELEYRRTIVRLYADEAVEVGKMLAEASRHLSSFSNASDDEEWPEGDVYVTIPDLSLLPPAMTGVEEGR